MKSVTVINPTNRRSPESHNGAACMSGATKAVPRSRHVKRVRPHHTKGTYNIGRERAGRKPLVSVYRPTTARDALHWGGSTLALEFLGAKRGNEHVISVVTYIPLALSNLPTRMHTSIFL